MWRSGSGTSTAATVGFVVVALGFLVGRADARAVRAKCDLTTTGVDADAGGKTITIVHKSDAKLKVKARKLAPNASFEVLANGVRIGTLTTTGGGSGQARFRGTPRSSKDQLLGFDPRGNILVVRDEDGEDSLECEIPDDSVDPNAVRCCLADEGGDEEEAEHAECEELTPANCDAEGGVNLGAGTCFPNPCGVITTTQGEEVRCCLGDADEDDQAECEDRTAEQCSMQHGVNLGPGSCDPNPCEPHPDPDSIRCCEPDDEGTECEHRTPEQCTDRGGIDKGPGMCEPHLCDDAHPDSIRCCEADDDEVECEHRTAAECDLHEGVNVGPGSCDPDPCGGGPDPDEIRCCKADGDEVECEHRTAAECDLHGGVNVGPGVCEPGLCGDGDDDD